MSFELTHNSYGKSKVRLTKVVRQGSQHELFEIDVAIQLEGDFDSAYTRGDNSLVIATDTIKNTVYVLAKRHDFESVESFALILATHFLKTYSHVTRVTADLSQTAWKRIDVDGTPHEHAFVEEGSHLHTAYVDATRAARVIRGGVKGLRVIKTTASAWENFHADEYRTLRDTRNRILGTTIDATWTLSDDTTDFAWAREAILASVLTTFATEFSPSAQFTLRQMGEAALNACAELSEISITLPNQHRIPFNLAPFGLQPGGDSDVFVTTDEPFGLIKGTIRRGESK